MRVMCVTLLVCALACAQQLHRVEGEVVETGDPHGELWAQLTDRSGGTTDRIPVTPDGRFVFAGVPDGVYLVNVLDSAGHVISSQPVTLSGSNQRVSISAVPEQKRETSVPGAKISVAALRHKPGKKALRIAEQAQKLAARGDHAGAVAVLEKAVALDARFVEARGNLGAEYVALHEYGRGAAELREAVQLDPSAAWLQSNLAFALYELRQLDEALRWARGAVALDSRNARGQYLLGWLLLRQPGRSEEGIEHLERAAGQFPQAHRTLADYYRARGNADLARREIERYRAADPAGHQAEVEGWLAAWR